MEELFLSLVAPLGGENSFSAFPSELTQTRWLPPPNWAFISIVVNDIFDRQSGGDDMVGVAQSSSSNIYMREPPLPDSIGNAGLYLVRHSLPWRAGKPSFAATHS